jgi:PAS domain S-box-containing protein
VTEGLVSIQAIIDADDQPVFALDRELRYTAFNRAHAVVMRALYGADIALGGRLPDYQTVAADRETSTANLERALAGERVTATAFSGENESRRSFEVVHVPQTDPHGTVVGVVVRAYDVTESRRAEEQRRASEEDFRTLVKAVPQIVWMKDPEGKNTYFNQQWVDYTGLSLEESYGDGWNAPFHPDDRQRAWDAWQRATQDDVPYSVECRLRRADGAYRWWLIRGAPLRDEDGTILKWFGTCTDIEDLKQGEQELQQSRALLQAAMDQSQAGIAIADAPDGRLRYVNQAALFIRGASAAEVVDQVDAARYVESWHIFHHDGTPYADDEVPLARAVLYGETSEAELIIRRDDHEDRVVLARAAPIRDAEGTVTAGVVVFHDITERKQSEDEIRRLNEELEQRVVSRTAQLEATNKELEAFAYSVSHDLRAPLRAIDGFSAMVTEDAVEHLTSADVEHLQRVRDAAQRMGLLIDDLLGLSRAARRDLIVSSIDLSGLAEEVLAELRQEQPERKVNVVIAPHLRADADPTLLRMILVNLLGNAWKFTSKHETARIDVGVSEAGGERIFFVRDDGAGFDTRYAQNLFGAFQRMHSPGEFEGTGIGLATVQRLVTRHGGRVWAEAEVEKGATFYFTLSGNGAPSA